ncbi:MAG: hypothetical protein AAFN10_08945 [Bacteroidota bacterium]
MNLRAAFLLSSCVMTIVVMSACGDIKPVWKGDMNMEKQGYTLHYSEDPVEFQLDLKASESDLDLMLELMISYYVGISRSELPLFIVLENENHDLFEYTSEVILKEDDTWLGIPQQNEIDYSLTHIAIPELRLKPGTYTLRIYANDEAQESIYGVVNIEARLYMREILPE